VYLSQLHLSPLRREVLRLLQDPYKTHAAIMRAFPPDGGCRPLFRVESGRRASNGTVVVLVQSLTPPDWSPLQDDLGDGFRVKVKEFAPAFHAGQRMRFRLRANPALKRDGKRLGLAGDQSQMDWFRRKGEVGGFLFRDDEVWIRDEGTMAGRKYADGEGTMIQFRTVVFEGALTVTAPERFAESLRRGVGPAKGFGCGLLSVGPA
jgi:CRISPR system Cascade subunit CasE